MAITGTGYFGIPLWQNAYLSETNNDVNFVLSARKVGSIKFGTGDRLERMRVDALGNVGIGTTAPYAKLTITETNV